jgi:hypothetical protein
MKALSASPTARSRTLRNIPTSKEPGAPAPDLLVHRRLGRHHRQILDGRGIIPPQSENFNGQYLGTRTQSGAHAYQANYRLNQRVIAPGASATVTHRMFAGAKVVDILQHYENTQNVPKFDYAVDWGWFWFLTKPFFMLLDLLQQASWAISVSPSWR